MGRPRKLIVARHTKGRLGILGYATTMGRRDCGGERNCGGWRSRGAGADPGTAVKEDLASLKKMCGPREIPRPSQEPESLSQCFSEGERNRKARKRRRNVQILFDARVVKNNLQIS